MEYRGDKQSGPGSAETDWREAVVMLVRVEDRYARLQKDLERLDSQVNAENGMKDRLAETRIISAERYKNAMRMQRCAYVVASALLVGLITWVTVQFGQMRDRDMLRYQHQLTNPRQEAPLPSTLKP